VAGAIPFAHLFPAKGVSRRRCAPADRLAVTKRHIMAPIKVPKAKFLLLSLVVMASLIVVQRFYLSRSDTGKPWALMSAWFGLCAWFSRSS
jgi:hypothetical protein